jgi:hypothetical protein
VIGRETGTYGSSGRLPAARGRVKEMGAVHGRCGGGVGAAKHRAGQGGPPRLRIRHSTTTARAAVGYRWLPLAGIHARDGLLKAEAGSYCSIGEEELGAAGRTFCHAVIAAAT